MRVGVPANHTGHFHEAGFYSSDAEFRALVVPFVEQGTAAGEPVVIGYDERKSDLLRTWLRDPSAVTFVTNRSLYANPARAIANYGRLFEQHIAAGAEQIRIAGDVPHAGNGGRFDGWDRYESAVNTVWDDVPVRSLCLYDTTTVSPAVRDVVERTHPRLLTAAGESRLNTRFEDTEMFAGLAPAPDPLEATAPLAELHDALPAEARRVLEPVARGRVDEDTYGDLLLAISEAASNALVHGRRPTTIRIWAAADRVVIRVRDSGSGPADPLAGLVPAPHSETGGVGLWMTHQLDLDVALIPAPESFTIRIRGGRVPASLN